MRMCIELSNMPISQKSVMNRDLEGGCGDVFCVTQFVSAPWASPPEITF